MTVQQHRAILLIKSHKLDTRPLDADPRARNAELRSHVASFWRENWLVHTQKMELKEELMV